MNAALRKLVSDGTPDPESIKAFVDSQTFSLVDENTVSFIYHGAAEAVNLKHWVHGLPSSQPFGRIGDSDLWCHTLDLPPCSRIEYKLEVVEGGDGGSKSNPIIAKRSRYPSSTAGQSWSP